MTYLVCYRLAQTRPRVPRKSPRERSSRQTPPSCFVSARVIGRLAEGTFGFGRLTFYQNFHPRLPRSLPPPPPATSCHASSAKVDSCKCSAAHLARTGRRRGRRLREQDRGGLVSPTRWHVCGVENERERERDKKQTHTEHGPHRITDTRNGRAAAKRATRGTAAGSKKASADMEARQHG